MRLVGVPLSADQITRFYEGFSNGVLWPLFHYLLEQIPLQVSDWDGYVEANEALRRRRRRALPPGRPDLGPRLPAPPPARPPAATGCPSARIGFFLHIPFPSEELFRTLPTRAGCCKGCWAPTWSASTRRPTSATSPPR